MVRGEELIDETERTRDMIAVHNLDLESIPQIAELGGFAIPSIAVVKDQYGHSEFVAPQGSISLILLAL